MDPTKGYITADVWSLIYQETLNQCDALDGLVDGIISEPDDCNPDFQSLLCTSDLPILPCLNPAQFDAIQKIHSPINGSDGQELISRYDPGAEKDGAWAVLLSGQVSSFTAVRYIFFSSPRVLLITGRTSRIGSNTLYITIRTTRLIIFLSQTWNLGMLWIGVGFLPGAETCPLSGTVVESF